MPNEGTIHALIHAASASAAAVGAGLAQIPGSDAAVLIPIQAAMIISIAKIHGHSVTDSQAITLIGTFTAALTGRTISQILIGWFPGIGNIINSATAAALTETIGWGVNKYFYELPK